MSEDLVQMAQRGVVTIPQALRKRYKLKPGDIFSLIDLGGFFLLSLQRSKIDKLADEVAQDLADRGESLESMLKVLKEKRRRGKPTADSDLH